MDKPDKVVIENPPKMLDWTLPEGFVYTPPAFMGYVFDDDVTRMYPHQMGIIDYPTLMLTPETIEDGAVVSQATYDRLRRIYGVKEDPVIVRDEPQAPSADFTPGEVIVKRGKGG